MTASAKPALLSEVAEYYSSKLAEHGESPRGVDWNGAEGQALRFQQLCKLIDKPDYFSLNDLGCGYGALYDFLAERYAAFAYCGIDVAEDMISAATQRHRDKPRARFVVSSEPDQISDYGIASGIFNVRFRHSADEWRSYVETTLDALDRTSRFGFSFNCLTAYSDKEKMRPDLYYADPGLLFDLCKRRYSRNVALLHDYGLYEFTILVRRVR